MSVNHRCICAICSSEMKQGVDFVPVDPSHSLSLNRDPDHAPAHEPNRRFSPRPGGINGPPQNGHRNWEERLREWAKILLQVGYLVLAFFKL